MACFSADGTFIEPGAPQDADSDNNDPTLNPAVVSGKKALFNINVKRSMADLIDGASQTVAFSEVIAGPDGSADFRGHWWGYFGMQYSHMYTPNSPLADRLLPPYCDPSKAPCDESAQSASSVLIIARSLHKGGVNVTLADGSVRQVVNSIDLAVWQALGSINGGEVVPADY